MSGRPQSTRWLGRAVIGMGLASLFDDLGHEMALAVLPAFLAGFGATPAALGIIEGAADGLASGVKLFAGGFVDRTGRRKTIAVLGYTTTGIATGAFALAGAWWHVLVARSLGWIGKGFRGPARDAMLADAVPAEARGRAFGFHRGMDTLGAVLGPALAWALAARVGHRAIFAASLVPGLLAAACFLVLVPRDDRPPQPHLKLAAGLRDLPRPFRRFLVAVALFGAGDFAHTLLILRASELLARGRPASAAGAAAAGVAAIGLYALHNVAGALVSYPAGHLADRIGKRLLLVLGYALGAAVALGFAIGPSAPWAVTALFLLGGVVLAVEGTLEGSLAADLVPTGSRGTGYGALAAVNGVGDLVSSAGVGLLWAYGGAGLGFGVAAVLCAAGATVLALLPADGAGDSHGGTV